MSVTARYEAARPLDRDAWRAWIWAALADVVEREPFLRVGIADEDSTRACFVHVPQVDLGEQVVWHAAPCAGEEEHEARLGELLERGHSALWPDTETRPPWKLTVVDSSDGDSAFARVEAVFSWHHAIGDGLSGKLFHERLLAALRERNVPGGHPPLASPVLRFDDAPVLPSPQEEAVKFTFSWWFILQSLWKYLGPSFLKSKQEEPWAGCPVDIHAPFRTKVRLLFVDEETRDCVLAVCRMHGTTLTGLLHALMLLSLARQLPSEHVFHSQTPMSLRPYVSIPNFDPSKSTAVLVTSFAHLFSPEQVRCLQSLLSEGKDAALEEKLWEIAAGVKAELKRRAGELPADDSTALLRFVGDLREMFRSMDGKPMGTTFEVSNVGIIDGGDAEDVRITRLVFSQSGSQVGAAVKASVAGCKGSGGVTISFVWQDGVLDDGLVEGVKRDLDTWMRNLSQSGRLQPQH